MTGGLLALRAIHTARSRATCFASDDALTRARIKAPRCHWLAEAELVEGLQDGRRPAALVAVPRLGPALLEALRVAPPALLALCGDEPLSDAQRGELAAMLPGTRVLGPQAHVLLGEGDELLVATEADELRALVSAQHHPHWIALAPTPDWLPHDLMECAAQGFSPRVLGYVSAESLDFDWERWARQRKPDDLIVPLGLAALDSGALRGHRSGRDIAAHRRRIIATLASQAMERHTGPLLPEPHFLHLLAQRLAATGDAASTGATKAERKPSSAKLRETAAASQRREALWAQLRRVLPQSGNTVGMEAPREALEGSDMITSYLMQRAIVRAEASLVASRVTPHADPSGEAENIERALEVLRASGETLSDHESKVVLRSVGLDVTRQAVATSASGAAQYADRIGYPVVLKALSPDLRRKSDVGGVLLDLANAAAVRRGYNTILSSVAERAPSARVDGVAVAEMVAEGTDLEVGILRVGPEALVLHARVLAEGFSWEPTLMRLPISPAESLELAHAILARASLPALRRAGDPDLPTLASVLQRLSRLADYCGERLISVEISPLRLLFEEGRHVALDARISQRAHLDGA